MDLSVIIVNWNVKELLFRSLDSILRYSDNLQYEIIIVDNDSKDGSVKDITRQYHKWIQNGTLKIIANDFNAGFAKANNQGLKMAQGEFVLFMNPDMELLENSFGKLISFMREKENVAACTTRLLYADKTLQPNVKNFPALCDQIIVLLKLHHFLTFLPCLKKYLNKNFDYTQEGEIEQAMGAFIFARKSIIEAIGGWDENYWLWWEDMELCKTMAEKGYKILFTPMTEIIHYEGKSFAQIFGLAKQKRFNRGMLRYFRKHHGFVPYAVLRLFQPASWLLTTLTQSFKIKARPQSRI